MFFLKNKDIIKSHISNLFLPYWPVKTSVPDCTVLPKKRHSYYLKSHSESSSQDKHSTLVSGVGKETAWVHVSVRKERES